MYFVLLTLPIHESPSTCLRGLPAFLFLVLAKASPVLVLPLPYSRPWLCRFPPLIAPSNSPSQTDRVILTNIQTSWNTFQPKTQNLHWHLMFLATASILCHPLLTVFPCCPHIVASPLNPLQSGLISLSPPNLPFVINDFHITKSNGQLSLLIWKPFQIVSS